MPKHHEHNELEALLGDLPMREPSPMLDERVAKTLRTATDSAATATAGRIMPWRALAIAAAVLVVGSVTLVVMQDGTPTTPGDSAPVSVAEQAPAESIDTPQAADRVAIVDAGYNFAPEPIDLQWSRDIGEEQRVAPNGRPYRAVVREVVDQRTWYDPETGATMQVTTPREELVILNQQTF